MVKYTGSKDIREVIQEGMRTPVQPITLATDAGEVRFRVTGTTGTVIAGRTTTGKLITINTVDPDHITIT